MRDASLSAIPDGPAKEVGIAVGEAAADAMLPLRADDGSGRHRTLHAGDRSRGLAADAARVRAGPAARLGPGDPVRLEEGSQFRSPPPPAIDTGKYAKDYNEVKAPRQVDSPFRPQDRTDVARFYAGLLAGAGMERRPRARRAPRRARRSPRTRGSSPCWGWPSATASIAAFETKYHYNLWRPVTAIRAGDTDGNRKTDPDGGWLPLIVTPPFPSYPSAHATVSGAARGCSSAPSASTATPSP